MDVVALAQFGVRNAVATLGTATSSDHVQRLFRLTTEIVFCFDGDKAGRKAAERALANTLPELKDGQQAKFLFLPEGEDPDTIVRHEGFEGFMRRVKRAQNLPDFLFQHLQTQADISRIDGKAKLVSLAKGWINKAPEGSIFKQLLMKQLSDIVGLTLEQISTSFEPEAPIIEHYTPTSNDYPVDTVIPDYYGHIAPPPQANPNTAKSLAVRISAVHRALAWLIRFPVLAHDVDLSTVKKLPEQEGRDLLAQVIELLQASPKHDVYYAFDFLCQHGLRETLAPIAASDYLWLEASNEEHQDELLFARLELEKIIRALTVRAPDNEYETLKKRVLALDPSLTDDEKQRYRELLKQKKQ